LEIEEKATGSKYICNLENCLLTWHDKVYVLDADRALRSKAKEAFGDALSFRLDNLQYPQQYVIKLYIDDNLVYADEYIEADDKPF